MGSSTQMPLLLTLMKLCFFSKPTGISGALDKESCCGLFIYFNGRGGSSGCVLAVGSVPQQLMARMIHQTKLSHNNLSPKKLIGV